MQRLPKYCKQSSRNLGYYYKCGKKVYLPGSYNSARSLVAYHRAMIDYRLELEKIVDQVADENLGFVVPEFQIITDMVTGAVDNECNNLSLSLQHLADSIELTQKQRRSSQVRTGEIKKPIEPTEPPAVVLMGFGGEPTTITGNTTELVEVIQEGSGEKGIAAALRQMTNDGDAGNSAQKAKSKITVQKLYDLFYDNIEDEYPDKVKQTKDDYRKSCKDLLALYGVKGTEGNTLVDDFGIKELKKVQKAMVKRGLSITSCNDYLTRIRVVFNWGAGAGEIDRAIAADLMVVQKLDERKTTAPPAVAREDVSIEDVNATLPHLPQMLQDMVIMQLNSAMRPGDLFILTWAQIDTSEDEWLYLPIEFKGQRHKDTDPIGLMPPCKEVLQRYKHLAPDELIFNQITNAKQMGRSIKRFTNEAFDRGSYLSFIKEACGKAGISPHWTPYQIRHRAITDMDECPCNRCHFYFWS